MAEDQTVSESMKGIAELAISWHLWVKIGWTKDLGRY